ncbi:stage II sporulation protein D [Paenibacillus sp. GCM10027626]|uniref:stage II sporulation protein D n=1 Tax=Paenibacillus sp. GCM10027626 TaxID=3273411 RepID=UPI00362B00BE
MNRKRLRWNTRRWWTGFAAGILLAVLARGVMYINDLGRHVEQDGFARLAEIESIDLQKDKAAAKATAAKKPPAKALPKDYDRTRVSVYLEKEKRIETVPLELYVRGVIAGEMPVEFEQEALKAQAIAARTYIYRRLSSGDHSGMANIQADVRNTVQHQVYVPLAELLSRWEGEQKETYLTKLNRAVEETKGQIVTYDGEPIQATFFSTSNGYTENASDYWASADIPYLRSVTSPWDKLISPEYKETTKLKIAAVAEKLGVKPSEVKQMRVLETTEGKRVKALVVGDKQLSGREVREKLGLPSSQFTWSFKGDEVEITTYGYGHGVGMSQWGANGMAQEGKTAKEILAHYYSGTKVETASKLDLQS